MSPRTQKRTHSEHIKIVLSTMQVDNAGIDILLVGDSVGMVVHGHDTTLPVTMDDMISHCRAVSRGARRPFLLGDLPFGSFESSPARAVESATRMLKEGLMDAVKIEGRVLTCSSRFSVLGSSH